MVTGEEMLRIASARILVVVMSCAFSALARWVVQLNDMLFIRYGAKCCKPISPSEGRSPEGLGRIQSGSSKAASRASFWSVMAAHWLAEIRSRRLAPDRDASKRRYDRGPE